MIDIIEKDGAVIITIENPTGEERKLISRAKGLKDNAGNNADSGIWGKFKCNQTRAEHHDKPSATEDNNGFVEILSFDDSDVPF